MTEVTSTNTANNSAPSTSDLTPFLHLREVLDQVQPEIDKLDSEHLLPITVDPVTAASIVRGALPKLANVRDQLAALPDFDIQNLDKLQVYARALAQANAAYNSASGPPQHFQELVTEATAMREQLVSNARVLAKRGYLNGEKLDELKGSVGYNNVINDLLTVVNMISANWANISGKTPVTLEELDRAYYLGDQLINDMGTRARTPSAVEKATLDRQQMYTVLVNAWDEVRRAVAYVRWNFGDADEIAPSLFAGRRRRSNADDASEPETSGVLPSTDIARSPANPSNQPAAAVAPDASTASPKVGVGLPGADPFAS